LDKKRINIAIIEPSQVIYEGFSNIILKAIRHSYVYWLADFCELSALLDKTKINLAIINPCIIQNRIPEFFKCKKQHLKISWIGLVYSCHDSQLLCQFNDTISILDSIETIVNKLNNSTIKSNYNVGKEKLTEREIDVLIQLVSGLSNKEIAEKLNISIHTVISHRKKIIEKTGIKSLPALTIFAISQHITTVDEISH